MWDVYVFVCVCHRLKWSHYGEKIPVRMSLGEELRWLDHLQMIQRQAKDIYSIFSGPVLQSYQSSRSSSAD